MAIAPDTEQAFLREVDEDYRRDRLLGFLRRYGRLVALGIGLFLVALGLGLWWRSHRAAQAGTDSERLTVALASVDAGGNPAAAASLKTLEDSPREGYRAAARLAEAGLLERKGDIKGAVASFQAIAGDAALPQPVRDLAALRSVAAEFNTLAPAVAIDRLKTLAVPGAPYYPSAAELTAVAWLKLDRRDKAGPLFAGIARDAQAPASLRGRAAAMATSLGMAVDAPATQPNP